MTNCFSRIYFAKILNLKRSITPRKNRNKISRNFTNVNSILFITSKGSQNYVEWFQRSADKKKETDWETDLGKKT